MSIVDHTSDVLVPYSVNDTYDALKKAVKSMPGFAVDRFDDVMRTVYLKAGVSLFSWGENITVTISQATDGQSAISVLSTPKTGVMFGGTMDMGKNRKNINTIMSALSKELERYPKIQIGSTNANDGENYNELRKLKQLLDEGVITQEEFDVKKKQLLGL